MEFSGGLYAFSSSIQSVFTDRGQEYREVPGVHLIPAEAAIGPDTDEHIRLILENCLPYSKYIGSYITADLGDGQAMGMVKRVFPSNFELLPYLGRRYVEGSPVYNIVKDGKPSMVTLPVKSIAVCSIRDLEEIVMRSKEDHRLEIMKREIEEHEVNKRHREMMKERAQARKAFVDIKKRK